MGKFLHHTTCPSCGSSDGNAVYEDGGTYCWVCGKASKGSGDVPLPSYPSGDRKRHRMASLIDGEVKAIPTRGITEGTAKKYRYSIGKTDKGKWVQIAPYYKDGQLVAQHYRTKDKKFWWAGEASGCELFGQHLFNQPGKMLVITEGEIDALTVSQVQGNKWPVVAITGSEKAPKDIATNMKFLQQYDEIILMFDDDDPGRKAAQECAKILPFGKAKIATINGYKDANEALMDDNSQAIISAIWNAKAYRPDGIVEIDDELIEAAMIPPVVGLPWWDDRLTQATFGRRLGEVYGFGAGTGIGKTDWMLQQASYDATELNQRVGLIFLEQMPKETLTRLAGKFARRVLHVPDVEVPPEDRRAALRTSVGTSTPGTCRTRLMNFPASLVRVSLGICSRKISPTL